MLPLHRTILETVAYYDVFDYPLTEFEVWKFLLVSDGEGETMKRPVSLQEIAETLEGTFLRKRLGRSRGFVFLHGRESLIGIRTRRQKTSDRNIRGARHIASIIRFFPFVRMAGLTGSLSMKNAERGSDWDFFLVLRSGYIWTGRAIVTGILHVLGLRRHGEKVSRRACLNFWVTTESLEVRLKDIFSSSEYFFMIPLFGERVFSKFERANGWIRRFRPNFFHARLPHIALLPDTWLARCSRTIGEVLLAGFRLEPMLRRMQQKKISANPKTHEPEAIIEATDEALIFLPHPRGPKIFETFRRRVSDIESAV